MAKLTLYNFKDKKKQDLIVRDDVFSLPLHRDVIAQTVQYHLTNKRTGLAQSKNRAEVRGGGKKPWKQKGTGRARQGSTRSPLWVGGGVALGPCKHAVSQNLNKKMRQLAFCSILSEKLRNGKLWAYDNLDLPAPKTKQAMILFKDLPENKNILIVADKKDDFLKLATRNVVCINLLECSFPSVLELLNNDFILLHKDVVKKIEKTYGNDDRKACVKEAVSLTSESSRKAKNIATKIIKKTTKGKK